MINKSDLPKFNPDIYTKITLNDLVVFSIHYLHNKNAEVTPEDIISACFMLFPKRFSLKKHPHWPDSAMVSRHWGVCRSKGYIAANDPGFKLTAKGVRLAEKVAKALGMEAPKRAAKPARKAHPVRLEEKTTIPPAVKKLQHPRAKARVVTPTPKARTVQREKTTSSASAKKTRSPRSKMPAVEKAKEEKPVQKEKSTPPAPIKETHPAHSKKALAAKKEKIIIIEPKEKADLQPTVGKVQPTWLKRRSVTREQKAQPVVNPPAPIKKAYLVRSKKVAPAKREKVVVEQKEKAPPPARIKRAHPIRAKKVPSAKKEKTVEIAQKEKVILQPAARKLRPKVRSGTQAKTTQPAPKKTILPRPVSQPVEPAPTRPAKLMKTVRPIWTEKIKPPEPVVRPVAEKVQATQPGKTIRPPQSNVTPEAKIRAGKFVRAMETSDAYIHYKKNGKSSKISEFDFRSLLLCTMESSPETLARNMQQFKGYASIHNRQDLLAFLNFCEDKLSYLLVPQITRLAKPTRKQ
jgi:hypothetical protein